jgi:two-component sensor histidine kinase
VRTTLSLPVRLVFLVAGTTLPLIVFAAAIVFMNYQADRKEASTRILEVTRSMMLVVDRELHSTVAALRVLALSLALQRDDLKAFRQQVESFLRDYPEGANLVVADRSGQQVLNMAVPEGAPLPMRVNLQALKDVLDTARPVVTNLFVGAVLQRPLIAVDVPVMRNGQVAYVLSFNPPLDVFTDIIRRQQPTPGWVVSVFDRAGVNVARTPNPERFVGQRASPSLYPALMAKSEGLLETVSLEGTPLLSAFSRSSSTGWSVAIGVPRRTLAEPLWRSLGLTIGTGLVFLFTGLAFALRMASRIARAEAHRELLINELNHRVKNTLATVQSIAARTFRLSSGDTDAQRAFESRLIALSGAHNALSEDKWQSASLRDMLQRVLEPYTLKAGGRLRLSGPDVRLRPRTALALAMVLHELAINAAKYGALATPEGRIAIEWTILGEGDSQQLRFAWRETGGPPVQQPERKGFGSVLIERSVKQELNGTAELLFEPTGLTCTVQVPLAAPQGTSGTPDMQAALA